MIHSEFTSKAAHLTVSLHGAPWAEPTLCSAQDITRGGMFVLTDVIPELFSDLLVTLSLPWGGYLVLGAQVVHRVPRETADATGTDAGVGLEFFSLDPMQRAFVQRLIDWTHNQARDPLAPVRTNKQTPGYLNTLQRDVLGAVDGRRRAQEIADCVKVSPHTVKAVLAVLDELDLISSGTRIAERDGSLPRVSARPTRAVPADPDMYEDRPTVSPSNPRQRTWLDDFLQVGSCAV